MSKDYDVELIVKRTSNLIAASPDLLEACKQAFKFIGESSNILSRAEILDMLEAAIYKADK